MPKVLVTESHLGDIADAIRAKNGGSSTYRPGDMAVAIAAIPTGITPSGSINITQNGTVDVTNYASAVVNVSGGGGLQGFEPYRVDNAGGTQTVKGKADNKYLVYFFDDNMDRTLLVNGSQNSSSTYVEYGQHRTVATTLAINSNTDTGANAVLMKGTEVTAYHQDSGSYISVVGGWVGYAAGGEINENAANGTSNSVTMNSAHSKLLVFIGACGALSGVTTVSINGTTYTIDNIGAKYDSQYGIYGAIEISGNSATTVTVTFPVSCYSYVSVIGLN